MTGGGQAGEVSRSGPPGPLAQASAHTEWTAATRAQFIVSKLEEDLLGEHRAGDRVRFVRQVQRSTGAAWPGDTGRVYEVTGDGYRVRKADGVYLDVVQDNEIEAA